MKIQGHLRDQPLPELFEVLASRCESGCLRIAFEPEPVLLYFKGGQLVDARTSFLQGLSAISLAFSRPKVPFEFDDEIVPPESTLTDQNERLLVSQILRVERTGERGSENEPRVSKARESDGIDPISLTVRGEALRYLPRQKLLTGVAALLVIALPAAVAMTLRVNKRASATPVIGETKQPLLQDSGISSIASGKEGNNTLLPTAGSVPTSVPMDTTLRSPSAKNPKAATKESASESLTALEESAAAPIPKQPISYGQQQTRLEPTSRTIMVVVQIEQGRVTEAWVKEPHSGLEAFEATAIRLTRQRRYPKEVTRTETVAINVTVNQ